MKKIALLIITLVAFSCSVDESNSGNTTDPIIGSWTLTFEGETTSLVFNENGTGIDDGYDFTWENRDDDFDSISQFYEVNMDGTSSTITALFSSDFNSVTMTVIFSDGEQEENIGTLTRD